MRSALAAVAVTFMALSACTYFDGETEPFRPPALQARDEMTGRDLYLRDCAWCHGSDADGTKYGPPINDGAASVHFMLTTGRMPIDEPDDRVDRRESFYSSDEIAKLVDYLGAFVVGPEVPDVHPEEGSLALGAELYAQNCAACHSGTGVGGALTNGAEAPAIDGSTPVEVAEAMLTGPGAMPVFGEQTFDDEQVDSILRYVAALQDPDDRGGSDLGGIGPVSEGAIAWILGLGTMLVIARLIGTRAAE
ncbi:MAG: c-type cytochrome [Actinomycetota bacterium]|nr:c-type cytochrome [Actinomycetota bacterium]